MFSIYLYTDTDKGCLKSKDLVLETSSQLVEFLTKSFLIFTNSGWSQVSSDASASDDSKQSKFVVKQKSNANSGFTEKAYTRVSQVVEDISNKRKTSTMIVQPFLPGKSEIRSVIKVLYAEPKIKVFNVAEKQGLPSDAKGKMRASQEQFYRTTSSFLAEKGKKESIITKIRDGAYLGLEDQCRHLYAIIQKYREYFCFIMDRREAVPPSYLNKEG